MAVPLTGGGGRKGLPLRKKGLVWGFLILFVEKFRLPLSSKGIKKNFFCVFPRAEIRIFV